MSQPYLGDSITRIGVSSRSEFIARTYTHLLGAIALFLAVEVWLFQTGAAETIARAMLGTSWLVVLGAFMITAWLASRLGPLRRRTRCSTGRSPPRSSPMRSCSCLCS